MSTSEIIAAVVILLIACVLIGMTRVYKEGFHSESGIQCGVDMAPCAQGTRCVNGYCQGLDMPYFPATSGLPVLPEGYMK